MDKETDPLRDHQDTTDISSREWLALSMISAVVYILLAYLIFYFLRDMSMQQALSKGRPLMVQLGAGIAAGILLATVIRFIMKRPPVSGVLDDFYIVRMLSRTRLTPFDRTQISLFAGVGEELLFRGAIQPILGIWFTSVIFVGLHGYFKFKSLGHLAFGLMMFGLSLALGYLFEYVGLVAAMSAHAVYDMIMLALVQQRSP